MASRFFFIIVVLLATPTAHVFAQESKPAPTPQVVNAQGVSILFDVSPLRGRASGIMAGEEGRVSFKISGTNGGVPLSNLRPVAWIDQRPGKQVSEAKECREKVQAFLQTSFSRRPTLDLNAYFILTLNQEPNISVIDPLFWFWRKQTLQPHRSLEPRRRLGYAIRAESTVCLDAGDQSGRRDRHDDVENSRDDRGGDEAVASDFAERRQILVGCK